MIIILSPAKSIDFSKQTPFAGYTIPAFSEKADLLVKQLKKLTPSQLSALMNISPKLAQLNAERFASWRFGGSVENSRQAIFAFDGDVYDGLQAYEFSEQEINFAQQHLRLLSGLYGILRPLDLIQPYRLEMGTSIETRKGKDLYAFWNGLISKKLKENLKESGSNILINLASQEYYKSVGPETKKYRVITPVFKEFRNGEFSIISFYAKRARGSMSRFIIRNHIDDPEHLKAFDDEGYLFNPGLSKGDNWLFTRG
jgi:cytoplasmic iron level regulating protein YaaA (DUF328/UPF0246 family)